MQLKRKVLCLPNGDKLAIYYYYFCHYYTRTWHINKLKFINVICWWKKQKLQNVLVKVPDQAEEEPVEDTTQTQREETTEDAPSDDETWEDKEGKWFCPSNTTWPVLWGCFKNYRKAVKGIHK